MGIQFLTHNSANFCPIMTIKKIYIGTCLGDYLTRVATSKVPEALFLACLGDLA